MSNYLKLLDKGAGAIGLKDDLDLIKSLVDLATHWPELKTHISGVPSVEEFLAKFIAHVDDEDIKKAFEKTGSAELIALHGKLVGLLTKLKAAVGEIPEEIRLLLSPISDFNAPASTKDGKIAWTPLDRTEKFGEGGDFSFEIGGSATLSLVAGDKVKLGDAEKKLLKIGAGLGVRAKGGGTAPFAQAKIKGEFSASAGADLAYYFDPGASGSLYGFEVAKRIPALPNPFDFRSVWAAFASDSLDLARISYEFDGTTSANVELAYANSLSFGQGLVADLAFSVSAEMKLTASYALTLSRAAAGGIDAALTRKRMSEEALGIGLKVDVDLSKLAKRVQTEVQKAVDKWDAALAEVKPFLSPGTLVQSKLSALLGAEADKLIKDPDLKAALLRDLRGAIGIDTSKDPALVAWLSGELTGAIDAARDVVSGKAGAAADRVLAVLGDRLPAFAQADVTAKLKPAIEKLIDGLDTELKSLVDRLFATAKDRLGGALGKFGMDAAQAIADADKALASVRKVIERVDKLIHDTVDTLGDASKMRITASLQAEERRERGEVVEIAGRLATDGETAAKAFHALTRGKPADLAKLLAADDPDDDFILDKKSKLRRYSKRSSKIAYEVVIFGFKASGETIASGEAAVELGADGSVHVDSKSSLISRFKGAREDREVSFLETFNLLLARVDGDDGEDKDERTIDVGVTIKHNDQSLKREELKGFIDSLIAAGLLDSEVKQRAEAVFQRWSGGTSDPDAWLKADIAAKLWLDGKAVRKLMAIGNRDDKNRLKRDQSVEIVKVALDAALKLGATGKLKEERLAKALGDIRGMYEDYPAAATAAEVLWDMLTPTENKQAPSRHALPESWPGQLPAGGPGHLRDDVKKLLGAHQGDPDALRLQFHDLVEMIDLMGQIYLAQPEKLGEASPSGWDENDYEGMQTRLANKGRGWLRTGGKLLFWIDREVQPWTVALLWTLAQIGRGDRNGAMSLTLTRPADAAAGVAAETVELARARDVA
jgi:hypothetical protein